jgi:hypothetical protein
MKMSLEICSRRRDHADLGTQNQARILLQSERYKN